jgi:UV DNA damage endonuclease
VRDDGDGVAEGLARSVHADPGTRPGMQLGFAVKVLGAGGLPSHDTRRHQSEPNLGVSLDNLEAIFAYCDDHDIRFYRMATGLAPYASHPDLTRFRDQPARFAGRLAEVGARARELGLRLTTHPASTPS